MIFFTMWEMLFFELVVIFIGFLKLIIEFMINITEACLVSLLTISYNLLPKAKQQVNEKVIRESLY